MNQLPSEVHRNPYPHDSIIGDKFRTWYAAKAEEYRLWRISFVVRGLPQDFDEPSTYIRGHGNVSVRGNREDLKTNIHLHEDLEEEGIEQTTDIAIGRELKKPSQVAEIEFTQTIVDSEADIYDMPAISLGFQLCGQDMGKDNSADLAMVQRSVSLAAQVVHHAGLARIASETPAIPSMYP